MSKPFFFRIDVADLFDFATDPEGEGMTLLQFAKELKKGESSHIFIQSVIDEATNYIENKRKAGAKGGLAKASSAKKKSSSALAKPSTPLARSSTEAVTVTEKKEHKHKTLCVKPELIPIGSHVKMTQAQLDGIVSLLKGDHEKYIELVNDYCAAKGKTYKDYAAAIRNFWRRDKEKQSSKQPKTFQQIKTDATKQAMIDFVTEGDDDGFGENTVRQIDG